MREDVGGGTNIDTYTQVGVAWIAQLVKRGTLNPKVRGLSPMLGTR